MSSGLLSSGQFKFCTVYCKRFLRRMKPNPAKPPILPPSKQVLYRVVNGDWVEPEYVEELLWRRHTYNNAMLSIRSLFKTEIEEHAKAGLGIEDIKRQEMNELDELIALNEKRNEQLAIERAERERIEFENMKKETIAEVEMVLKAEEENVIKRTEEVAECIKQSEHFITRENLRSKIEEALENPVVFDFAIDLDGKKLVSRQPVKYLEGQPARQKGRLYDSFYNVITPNKASVKSRNIKERNV